MNAVKYVEHYLSLGWALVPIPSGAKKPEGNAWQENPVTNLNQAHKVFGRNSLGVGLLHSRSGTAVLDIDNEELSRLALLGVGVSLDALLTGPGPKIQSAKGVKPLYRIREGMDLGRKVLAYSRPDKSVVTVFELRTGNCQDVLPPSLHPSGVKYKWVNAPKIVDDIPYLPSDLYDLWRNWGEYKDRLEQANPWRQKSVGGGKDVNGGKDVGGAEGGSEEVSEEQRTVINTFNSTYNIRDLLENHGYIPASIDKYLAPSSTTGDPGVTILKGEDGKEKCYSHHGSDPLNNGHSHDAFSVFTVLEHNGNFDAALDAAADLLGMEGVSRIETKASSFNLTDYGNAERLVAFHGDDIRYVLGIGWIGWNGEVWETGYEEVERRAKETVRRIYDEVKVVKGVKTKKKLLDHAIKSESRRSLEAMVALARSEPNITVKAEALDPNRMLINVRNGALDLRTGQLSEHAREYYCTRMADVAYDPAATCPLWERFQLEIANGDEELVRFKQRFYGYCLTGDVREQVVAVMWGGGGNGKSTEINTIRDLMGGYGVQTGFDTFLVRSRDGSPRNDIARLNGSRLVVATESDRGKKLSEPLIKQAASTEPIPARFLYRETFNVVPTFKVCLVTNYKPIIQGTDLGVWRRVKLIPYNVKIYGTPKEDKFLEDKLAKEASGILNWMVKGCLEWARMGLGIPASVAEATEQYRRESDVLADFLEDRCVVDDSGKVTANRLYAEYEEWCLTTGEKQLSEKAFGTELTERGFPRSTEWFQGKTQKVRTGLLIKKE